jgi:hypothetical protein
MNLGWLPRAGWQSNLREAGFTVTCPAAAALHVDRCASAGNAGAAITSQDKLAHGPPQWGQIEG